MEFFKNHFIHISFLREMFSRDIGDVRISYKLDICFILQLLMPKQQFPQSFPPKGKHSIKRHRAVLSSKCFIKQIKVPSP